MKSSTEVNGLKSNASAEVSEVSTFRRILPQILASTIKNLLLLDLSFTLAFPAIVIPATTGILNQHNTNEYLRLSPSQASWFASIAFICQPVGSLMSGLIAEPLGRKRAMFFVNIPHVIAWLMMYNASEVYEIFVANVLFGLGVGLMEAPIITYVGEICEPSIRGVMTALSGITVSMGFFVVYLLNTLMDWRHVALVCFIVPITTMIAICFVPETPLWLLSKNRTDDAQKSLQWLRGWVSAKRVNLEFESLKRYIERSNSCDACTQQNLKCVHPAPTMLMKIKELKRRKTLTPLFLVLFTFFLSTFNGFGAIRPYIVQILKAYGVPIEADWATVVTGMAGIAGNVALLCGVHPLGKRKVYLFALFSMFTFTIALAVYGFIYLPRGWSSFDHNLPTEQIGKNNYVPLIIVIALVFSTFLGAVTVPWMLISEVFPLRCRGIVTGIAAGCSYAMAFVATKLYYNLETWLSIPGVMLLYGIIGIIGFVCIYLVLPETENHSLEDIELFFSDKTRKLTDRKITKSGHCVPTSKREISVINGIAELGNGNTKRNGFGSGCDNKAFAIEY